LREKNFIASTRSLGADLLGTQRGNDASTRAGDSLNINEIYLIPRLCSFVAAAAAADPSAAGADGREYINITITPSTCSVLRLSIPFLAKFHQTKK
jgi:hypothetical protein